MPRRHRITRIIMDYLQLDYYDKKDIIDLLANIQETLNDYKTTDDIETPKETAKIKERPQFETIEEASQYFASEFQKVWDDITKEENDDNKHKSSI